MSTVLQRSLAVEVLEAAVVDAFRGRGGAPADGVADGVEVGVGVELEVLPFRRRWNGPPTWVPLDELRALVDDVAHVSFEPGGQVELSPPPGASPAAALGRLEAGLAALYERLEPRGIGLLEAGLDPWHGPDAVGLQLTSPRYRAMERHMAAIGRHGRAMMLRSAALQVAVDLQPGADGAAQWRLANLAGPVLAAVFANAPVVAGLVQPGNGARTAMWERVDPSRGGSRCVAVNADAVAAYLDCALRAEAVPLARGDGSSLPFRQPFGVWLAAGGARPDAADVAHHISTLFPPVRPRGACLEVRVLDSLPRRHREVAVAVVAALLGDPAARDAALALLEGGDPAARWRAAGGAGVGDARLRREACALLAVAAEGAGEAARHGGDAIARFAACYTAHGRAPGDDLRAAASPWS